MFSWSLISERHSGAVYLLTSVVQRESKQPSLCLNEVKQNKANKVRRNSQARPEKKNVIEGELSKVAHFKKQWVCSYSFIMGPTMNTMRRCGHAPGRTGYCSSSDESRPSFSLVSQACTHFCWVTNSTLHNGIIWMTPTKKGEEYILFFLECVGWDDCEEKAPCRHRRFLLFSFYPCTVYYSLHRRACTRTKKEEIIPSKGDNMALVPRVPNEWNGRNNS